jgi:hypothetical protein
MTANWPPTERSKLKPGRASGDLPEVTAVVADMGRIADGRQSRCRRRSNAATSSLNGNGSSEASV